MTNGGSEAVSGARRPWLAATLVGGGLLAAALAGLWLLRGRAPLSGLPAAEVRRGTLEISVTEGGSVKALESLDIRCEIRQSSTKILKLVEEGCQVGEADIAAGKVLVELDSSDLKNRIVQQDNATEQAMAGLVDAQESYAIQEAQNRSDLKAAEQKARFARLDLDKYLGAAVAGNIVAGLGLERELELAPVASTDPGLAMPDAPAATTGAGVLAVQATVPEEYAPRPLPRPAVDFAPYASLEALGDGEAKQKLRKFCDDLQAAQREQSQAQATLEGTRRLEAGGFVTRVELERDTLANEGALLKVDSARTARDLFLRYDMARGAEDLLSKQADAIREVIRARRVAISRLAQAQAKLSAAQGQADSQQRTRKELYDQLAKCTIRATKPGLVIYGSGQPARWNEEPIREGTAMREGQAIITIPDMRRMAVGVKVHESYIKKIRKGLRCRVTVDAFPDRPLTGEVIKVAVLPDAENRWLNPDLKVYLTEVAIDGSHDWLKPGMSAKVEILVANIADALLVPLQAVAFAGGKTCCEVAGGPAPGRREVEVGESNDSFIEVRKGLAEGERVLLRPPAVEAAAVEAPAAGDARGQASPAGGR